MGCVACECSSLEGTVAFLAGVAFVATFNQEAMVRLICPKHIAELAVRAEAAAKMVPASDRRIFAEDLS